MSRGNQSLQMHINHTPRDFEKELPETPTPSHIRRKPVTATSPFSGRDKLQVHQEKQETPLSQEASSAMGVTVKSPIDAATTTALRSHRPDCQYSLQPRIAPNKGSNLQVPQSSSSYKNRRHSWTSNSRCLTPNQERSSLSIMRAGATVDPDPFLEDQDEPTSRDLSIDILRDQGIFLTKRPGATWDMALFLRNTGPQTPPKDSPLKELSNKLPCKKKNRGIFRKWKESSSGPSEENHGDEERMSVAYVTPEAVKQKTTARGNKYLQIIPQQTLDFSQKSSPQDLTQTRGFPSLPTPPAEPFGNDATDPWMSSFSTQQTQQDPNNQQATPKRSVNFDESSMYQSNRPRTPLSYISEAASHLPPIETGFGLSIIQGSTEELYLTGSESDGEDASNSIHESASSSPSEPTHGQIESDESAEMPLLEQRNDSATGEEIYTIPDFPQPTPRAVEKENHDHSVKDDLAGQGLHRPQAQADAERKPSSATATGKLLPSASFQSAGRDRDASVRAKKIKALQDARRNIDDLVKERVHQKQTSPVLNRQKDGREDGINRVQPPFPVLKHAMSSHVSQTRQAFEQGIVSRGRSCKKPAPLVLRERSTSRRGEAMHRENISPYTPLPETPLRRPSDTSKLRTPSPPPPTLPLKYRSRNTPSTSNTNSIYTPNSHNAKQPSTSSLSSITAKAPQAVTVTSQSAGALRTSVCSSHVSPSKETRLEARLDALERENKLLEAALMAVLKTSGTLNRCPCAVLKDFADSVAPSTTTLPSSATVDLSTTPRASALPRTSPSQSRAATPLPRIPSSELPRVAEDVHETDLCRASSTTSSSARRGSTDSNGSGISALEVYLRTKIGVRRSGGSGSSSRSSSSM